MNSTPTAVPRSDQMTRHQLMLHRFWMVVFLPIALVGAVAVATAGIVVEAARDVRAAARIFVDWWTGNWRHGGRR